MTTEELIHSQEREIKRLRSNIADLDRQVELMKHLLGSVPDDVSASRWVENYLYRVIFADVEGPTSDPQNRTP